MLLRIGIALVALGVIFGVASAIFWDGPHWEETVEYRVVGEDGNATGENVVLIREDDRDGPFFFPFIPLVVAGGVLITIALVNRGRGGGGPGGRFDEWHREAHRENGPPSTPAGA